jgi:hypothetical protein
MELDELKGAWQALDSRLERQHALYVDILRHSKLTESRSALQPLQFGQWLQIAAGILVMLLFAPFWFDHRNTLHLLIPGLAMHAYGLMMVLAAARSLILIHRVDYSEPVVEIQQRLAELRVWRARVEQPLFAVLGCFIWIPMLLVIFDALGADVWVRAPQVVYWYIVSGFVCLAVLYGITWGMRRSGSERTRTAIENSFIGKSVRRAQRELDEIGRFGQET